MASRVARPTGPDWFPPFFHFSSTTTGLCDDSFEAISKLMDFFELLYAAVIAVITGLALVSHIIIHGRTPSIDMMNTRVSSLFLEPWAVSLTCAEAKTSIHGRDAITPPFLMLLIQLALTYADDYFVMLLDLYGTPRMVTLAAL
jgi:hypothetical protein